MVHQVVKPEKIAAVAAVALEQRLVVPAVFQREGIDQYKGADNDTINVKVEGVLPYRSYGWRNDRSSSIQFDEYTEYTVPVTFGGDIYSAVRLTDEQNDFDLPGWTKLAIKQTEALGRGLEQKAVAALEAAPFEVVVQLDEDNLKSSLVGLRKVMNRLRAPGSRSILIGSDIEAALLLDPDLSFASNVGEADAVSALHEASLGRRYGFDFVVADELATDSGVALVPSAMIFATGAPSVPQSVPFGATASYNGVALTWLRDYETEKRRDRSVFNTYQGFRAVEDPLIFFDGSDQPQVSDDTHFVRAVKIVLGDSFAIDISNTELSTITGIVDEGTIP
jgi:hypothetical protein